MSPAPAHRAPNVTVVLPETVSEWLARAAQVGYPHEVCGLLVGRRSSSSTVIERAEAAGNLERERAADRYTLDPVDYLAIDARARRDGLDIVGVWHTHPDHPAEPSSTDLEAAWPDYVYLIISVAGGEVVDQRAWILRNGSFAEQATTDRVPAGASPAGS